MGNKGLGVFEKVIVCLRFRLWRAAFGAAEVFFQRSGVDEVVFDFPVAGDPYMRAVRASLLEFFVIGFPDQIPFIVSLKFVPVDNSKCLDTLLTVSGDALNNADAAKPSIGLSKFEFVELIVEPEVLEKPYIGFSFEKDCCFPEIG